MAKRGQEQVRTSLYPQHQLGRGVLPGNVVQSTADMLGLGYKYMLPGYYYVDSANNEITYLRSIDQVKKWVASLEPLEGSTPISGEEEDKMWDHLRKFRRSRNL